jgi:hypothetical protein
LPQHLQHAREGSFVHPPLERGVYVTPYCVFGRRAVFAVDRHGEQRVLIAVLSSDLEEQARAIAWAALEEMDPVPDLQLV